MATDLPEMAATIAENKQGQIWIGTTSRGIRSVAVRGETLPTPPPSPFGSGLGRVISDHAGTVYAFNSGHALALLNGRPAFAAIKHWPGRPITAATVAGPFVWVVHPAWRGMTACVARLSVVGETAEWTAAPMAGLSSSVILVRSLLRPTALVTGKCGSAGQMVSCRMTSRNRQDRNFRRRHSGESLARMALQLGSKHCST